MNRAECIRIVEEEYRNKRARDEQLAEERLREAAERDPEILRLREANALLALETMKKIAILKDAQLCREAANSMRQQGIANNAEIVSRLRKAGFPEDHLTTKYECPICKDTGIVGEAPSRFCECFERTVSIRLYEDGSLPDTERECFERFDSKRIPEADGQRERTEMARTACEKFANSFPRTPFQNMVLTGAGGLGKTFLLNCVYKRVIENGHEAIRITAYRMFEAMRSNYLADGTSDNEFDALLQTPLLLIDDLGTEPIMRNITIESLFVLLNERAQNGRHTIVSTNLSPVQIQERYGERVMSRMFDRTRCATLLLKGKDLRKQ